MERTDSTADQTASGTPTGRSGMSASGCRIVAEPLGNAKISAIYTGYGVVEDFTVFPHTRLCRFSSPTPQRAVPYQYTTNPCDWNCSVTRFFNAADGPF